MASIFVDSSGEISGNEFQENGIDVVDDGTGNWIWKKNVYTTGSVPPCP